jgi:glycosyltransferase involved in cell wall biosynthesis
LKNICFVNSTKFWGGGEKLLLDHALAFREKGYKVSLACHADGELSQRAKADSFEIIDFEAKSLSFLNPLKLGKLFRHFKYAQIDTVIFTTSHDAKPASIAANLARIKRIVYLRGLAVPIKNTPINRWLIQSGCTHVVANSRATKNMITKNMPTIANKVDVIYHGIKIPTNPAPKLPQITNQNNGIIIGNAGRLTKQKGQHLLIDVALLLIRQKVNFTIYIAGTGELLHDLSVEIEKHKLQKHIILLNFVDDIHRFMQSIDVFVLTSAWEGFGFVLAEAMANQKPVIAFDVSSNPEIIVHEHTGILVPLNNPIKMADAIISLANNAGYTEKLGIAGKKHISQKFELSHSINLLEQLLLHSQK